ncbi:hypothetical protein MNBD_GAMMA13-1412 [hydrothermal vent metagenome]|uniref:Uncharacterized protein n=1 Tax=hydrothermal vent metagenome TaxID=652676 RepID=A0A3B0YIV2_9ZZZZ
MLRQDCIDGFSDGAARHDCRVEFIRPSLSIRVVIGRMNSALQAINPMLTEY